MTYRSDIDALKGIAILAVMLFHMGVLKSGYLGVDVFFVINGFLIIPSLCRTIPNNDFKYFRFLRKRTVRLLPLVAIAGAICMLIGFIGMLPDNYENIAETVIAGNMFSENILSALTTKNYWGIANDYKPLMHLLNLGILFEFYALLPLILLLVKKVLSFFNTGRLILSSKSDRWIEISISVLFVISLLLYIFPGGTEANKFYFIQYRAFEFLLGGLAGIVMLKCNGGVLLALSANYNSATIDSTAFQPCVLLSQ